jgi:hypothetical protein
MAREIAQEAQASENGRARGSPKAVPFIVHGS